MNGDILLRTFQDTDKVQFETWLSEAHVAKWYENPADWIYEIENRQKDFSLKEEITRA